MEIVHQSENILLSPGAFNLPSKFIGWRPNQESAILKAINTPRRVLVEICPTGFGKSLVYITSSLLSANRTVFLTSTKGLQSQLINDFRELGIVDIRGRNSYKCLVLKDGSTCDYAPCIGGYQCPLRVSGCLYFDALKRAQRAKYIVTNYACWMSQNEYGEGFGSNIDYLVCDEAHDIPSIVSSFLTVTLDKSDSIIEDILPRFSPQTIGGWKSWAEAHLDEIEDEIEALKSRIILGGDRQLRKRLAKYQRLFNNLKVLNKMTPDWIWDGTEYSISFSPIWPGPYCEDVLFHNIKRVLLTSGSICGKTINKLGLSEDAFEMIEYPHSFPVQNRRLIHIPTIRVNYRSSDMDLRELVMRIDQIIRGRTDRKGIIHTVSYPRKNFIMTNSKFGDVLISHNNRGIEAAVRKFKLSSPPAVLISPSVTTGYDFPDDECRYQIIAKLAYPDTRDKITKARTKDDSEYGAWIAMQQLVQTVGRAVRSEDDFAENFILDDNIKWFLPKYSTFAPKWFADSYIGVRTIPQTPELRTPKPKKENKYD